MSEVAWLPCLLDQPVSGAWVAALEGDGVLVHEGDTGFVVGSIGNLVLVRWGDHQCSYPRRLLTRIDKPLNQRHWSMTPITSWRPMPEDRGPDGLHWGWIGGAA